MAGPSAPSPSASVLSPPPAGPIPSGARLLSELQTGVTAPATFREILMAPAGPAASRQLSPRISRPPLASVLPVAASTTQGSLKDNAFNDFDGSWQVVGGRRRKPLEKARPAVSSFKELLFKRAKGKCFKCLLPDHRVAQCTNLTKCLLCLKVELRVYLNYLKHNQRTMLSSILLVT
jgi:hypothetical protein